VAPLLLNAPANRNSRMESVSKTWGIRALGSFAKILPRAEVQRHCLENELYSPPRSDSSSISGIVGRETDQRADSKTLDGCIVGVSHL